MDGYKNFIQWKGTDVCIDLNCDCGTHYHFDGMFLYAWACYKCGAIYEMGYEVEMKRVEKDGKFTPIIMTEENE